MGATAITLSFYAMISIGLFVAISEHQSGQSRDLQLIIWPLNSTNAVKSFKSLAYFHQKFLSNWCRSKPNKWRRNSSQIGFYPEIQSISEWHQRMVFYFHLTLSSWLNNGTNCLHIQSSDTAFFGEFHETWLHLLWLHWWVRSYHRLCNGWFLHNCFFCFLVK